MQRPTPLDRHDPSDGPTPSDLDAHRSALLAHAYRMLGSATEAEDAVQEAFVRGLRGLDGFEGRAALRTWLTRITTRVCLDALRTRRRRRERPLDAPPGPPDGPVAPTPPERWIEPAPDAWALAESDDPAEQALRRQQVRLAFVAALQRLPPRQRAALLLTQVLDWSTHEAAETLDATVPSVRSALQRARATLTTLDVDAPPDGPTPVVDAYVHAFETWDVDGLARLLADDVVFEMPPIPLWLRGPEHVVAFLRGTGAGCEGSRLVPVAASGAPSFAQYKADGTAWGLVVLEVGEGRITGVDTFLDVDALFPVFGLPLRLSESTEGISPPTDASVPPATSME